jgi:hypothetical protein
MHPDLQNALLGAGLGGLGGLGMGLMSKRKKNPLTSALTGAALGGTLGYALPAVYRGMNTPPTTGNAAQDAQIAAKWHSLSGPEQLMHFAKGTLPTLDAGPAPPGEPGTLAQQAKDQTGVTGAINKTLAQGAGGIGGYIANHPGATTAGGALLAGQGLHKFMTAPGQTYRDVRQGILSTPAPPPPTVAPGGTATVTPAQARAARLHQFLGESSSELGRLAPITGPQLPTYNTRWQRYNPFRTWNEGVLGRGLEKIQAGGGPIRGRLATHFSGITPEMVESMQHAGLAGRPTPGLGRRIGGFGAKVILPQLAIHAAPMAWNWASNMLGGGQQE